MEHSDYKYDIGDCEAMIVEEPTINMGLHRTASFWNRHNANSGIEHAVPLHEGFEEFRKKLTAKHCEKDQRMTHYFQ